MKIFHDNGYVNIGEILDEGFPFNFIVAPIGIVKTRVSGTPVKMGAN